MSRDDEWTEWANDFRGGDEPGAPAPAAMLARVRRETWKQRGSYAVELLACVFLVGFYLLMMRRLREGWFVAMASANFAFAVAWMGYLTHVRQGTWAAPGRDTESFLTLTRARREADLRWARFARGVTAALLVFVAGWAPFVLSARWERYSAEPWRAVVGFGGAIAIGVAVLIHHTRRIDRASRELAALDSARAE